MTCDQFVTRVEKRVGRRGAQRYGQLYMNELFLVRPDLYRAIQGTAYDPFYRDDLVPEFLEQLSKVWEGLT